MGNKNIKIELFSEKSDCCGCMACANICPQNAIFMKKDAYGFLYPQINHELCVGCGLCKKACNFQNKIEKNNVIKAYAATCIDKKVLMESASGGLFAVFAQQILKNNGYVFGCAMEKENGELNPRHIGINKLEQLYKLQGSKYVQSDIGNSYKQVKELLKSGKSVLFSGTPCQIAGLYGFLQNKDYENLITIDIICHGTPSADLFKSYINFLEKKKNIKIEKFKFRDKTFGWGLTGSITFTDKKGKKKTKAIYSKLSSYYHLFLNADIYQGSCYKCKYTNSHRPADITIGDFWGFAHEYPECLVEKGGNIDTKNGISCVLINTNKGHKMLEYIEDLITVKESNFTVISKRNGQLVSPSVTHQDRNHILNLYSHGYEVIEKWYKKRIRYKKLLYIIINKIPYSLIKRLKKIGRKILK